MFRSPAVLSVATATLCVLTLISSKAVAWQYVDEIDGVDIYERDARYLGNQTLQSVVEVDAPIGRVISVFTDPDERSNWMSRVADHEVLHIDGDVEDSWVESYWMRIDMPFPLSDRDYVLASSYELNPEEQKLTVVTRSIYDERKPENGCCVRAQSVMRYTVEAIPGEDRTRIEMIAETDLDLDLPRHLIRSAGSDWSADTLSALAALAMSEDVPIDERVKDWP